MRTNLILSIAFSAAIACGGPLEQDYGESIDAITVGAITECTGSTPSGSTAWAQHDANTLSLVIDTSACGFQTTPSYFTTLHGSGFHWKTVGVNAHYNTGASSFIVHVVDQNGPVTPAVANQRHWRVEWRALPRSQKTSASNPSVCTGRTTPQSTAWTQVPGVPSGLYVDIDTTDCGFTSVPRYFTSVEGTSSHAYLKGVTSIYLPTATGFRVYVNSIAGAITPQSANAASWNINWNASLAGTETSHVCANGTPSSGWSDYLSGAGIYRTVNISSCGLSSTPRIFTSLGGNWNHWVTTGATSIYSPSSQSFTVYIPGAYTPAQADADGWHINWAVVY